MAGHGVFEPALWGARDRSLAKAHMERELRFTTTVFLLPNTTDVRWFHSWVYNYKARSFYAGIECRFVEGRINFDPPPGQASIANVKGSIIVIVRPV